MEAGRSRLPSVVSPESAGGSVTWQAALVFLGCAINYRELVMCGACGSGLRVGVSKAFGDGSVGRVFATANMWVWVW